MTDKKITAVISLRAYKAFLAGIESLSVCKQLRPVGEMQRDLSSDFIKKEIMRELLNPENLYCNCICVLNPFIVNEN